MVCRQMAHCTFPFSLASSTFLLCRSNHSLKSFSEYQPRIFCFSSTIENRISSILSSSYYSSTVSSRSSQGSCSSFCSSSSKALSTLSFLSINAGCSNFFSFYHYSHSLLICRSTFLADWGQLHRRIITNKGRVMMPVRAAISIRPYLEVQRRRE